MKRSIHLFLSFYQCCFYFPAVFLVLRRSQLRGNWKKRVANRKRDDCNRTLFYFARINRGQRCEMMVYMFPLRILKRGGERTFVTSQRSDLFHWDVGTSDQFTKCPVKHGGPIIVSMIRTSFRPPIRHTRTL